MMKQHIIQFYLLLAAQCLCPSQREDFIRVGLMYDKRTPPLLFPNYGTRDIQDHDRFTRDLNAYDNLAKTVKIMVTASQMGDLETNELTREFYAAVANKTPIHLVSPELYSLLKKITPTAITTGYKIFLLNADVLTCPDLPPLPENS